MSIKLLFALNLVIFVLLVHQSLAACVTPNGELGECVSLTSCPAILRAFANPIPEMQEYLRKYLCANDRVCCASTNKIIDVETISNKRYCGYQHKDDYISNPENGISIDEFPWTAGIRALNPITKQEQIVCGGTLINTRYVLTAAHCEKDDILRHYSIIGVRLGEFYVENKTDCVNIKDIMVEECNDFQDFGIEELNVHPFYMPLDSANDIALIRLDKKVTYSDYIRPICLPLFGIPFVKPGELLFSTGWGKTEETTKGQTKIKKKIVIKSITNQECQLQLLTKSTRLNVTHYQMCTENTISSRDHTCHGDSGGPIMVYVKHQWYIVGITSYGLSGCGEGSINVQTKVSEYIPWITENMRE